MVQRLKAWVQVFCFCIISTVPLVTGKTRSADKAALLAFKESSSRNRDLLPDWTSVSDPCSDSWSGISCKCSDLQLPLSAAACTEATAGSSSSVILLELGADSAVSQGQFEGVLAPLLGNITYLQSLRLDGQGFEVREMHVCILRHQVPMQQTPFTLAFVPYSRCVTLVACWLQPISTPPQSTKADISQLSHTLWACGCCALHPMEVRQPGCFDDV